MKLPGFTVDSSLGASHEHYRINCPEHQPVGAIPQSSTLECYLECTRYCEQLQPFEEVERCLIGCKQVCEALPPRSRNLSQLRVSGSPQRARPLWHLLAKVVRRGRSGRCGTRRICSPELSGGDGRLITPARVALSRQRLQLKPLCASQERESTARHD
jgi:hypothetical protein